MSQLTVQKKMSLQILLVLFCVFEPAVVFGDTTEVPKATLMHGGVLIGSILKTAVSGREVRAFRGIPYGKPPTGELRFKASLPFGSWTGERSANQNGSPCLQGHHDQSADQWIGDEDCLYLNVYTPKSAFTDKPLSVMVFFYGGCWIVGEGSSNWFGPDRLLEHDIVLVVPNYRLGTLGFLSTLTADCSGNFGLKDQLLVMQWIQENINGFGGNPDDVTLFGESAGAASIGYHMYSTKSKGLFHKAILQSGTHFDSWASVDKTVTLERARKLGQTLDCGGSGDKWAEMMKCLREKPTKQIAHAITKFFEFDFDPLTVFTPVVEPESEEALISKHPRDIIEPPSGSIPIMIGVTADEGVLKSARMIQFPDDVKPRFDDLLPLFLFYKHKPKEVQMMVTAELKQFYFNGKVDWTKDDYQNLTDLFSDGWFYSGLDRYLRERFAFSKRQQNIGSTYVYMFDQRGPISATNLIFGYPEFYGVGHLDDLIYLFPLTIDPVIIAKGDKYDQAVRQTLPELWTNFARFGNPTPPGTGLPEWKKAVNFPVEYVQIGSKITKDWSLLRNRVGLTESRMNFWRKLEPVLQND